MIDANAEWIIAISTFILAITAILSVLYYFRSLKVSIAKDKPLVRIYIEKYLNPPFPSTLLVKNDYGSRADEVTLNIDGRKFGPFSLMVNESQNIQVEVTDELKIDSLTYEDIHGTKFAKNNIIPINITKNFGMR